VSTNTKQLELLLNSLLEKESSPLPYAFYVNNMEVTVSLEETLTQIQQSGDKLPKTSTDGGDFSTFEDTITVSYQPLSVFRVRPVTRCVEVIQIKYDYINNNYLNTIDNAWAYRCCSTCKLFSRWKAVSFGWWRLSGNFLIYKFESISFAIQKCDFGM